MPWPRWPPCAAVRDRTHLAHYVAEVLAARELLCRGLDALGIPYFPSQANFVLFDVGPARHRGPRPAARAGRSGARPQLRTARLRARHRRHRAQQMRRFLAALEGDLVIGNRILVFDMDGVLVDVTGSYRETIRRRCGTSPAVIPIREEIQELKNHGGWNNDWALSQPSDSSSPAPRSPMARWSTISNRIFLGDGRRADPPRGWIARPGLLERLAQPLPAGGLHGPDRAGAAATLSRFAAQRPSIR